MTNKIVTVITGLSCCSTAIGSHISDEQMRKDYSYYKAQKLLKAMLENGLISIDEFNKISEKNRQTFSPYLAEIMP